METTQEGNVLCSMECSGQGAALLNLLWNATIPSLAGTASNQWLHRLSPCFGQLFLLVPEGLRSLTSHSMFL